MGLDFDLKRPSTRYRFGYRFVPKPYFIPRPSGLYVRFLVPVHARPIWGSRFILKSLGTRRGDEARLAAARLGYALAQFFSGLRAMGKKGKSAGVGADMAYIHIDGRRIRHRITDDPGQWTAHENYKVEERLDGSWVIIADGPEDHENAMDMVQLLRSIPPDPQFVRTRLPTPPADGPMLEQRVELFLEQFNQKQRAEANKLDTAFTMRLFVGIVGDKPLSEVGAEDMDRLLDALAHWPPNASKRAPYKDLSPREVVIVAKRKDESAISLRTREKHLDRLRVFFNWALERRDIDRSPCASLHVMTREQEDTQSRRAFTSGELGTIFHPAFRELWCRTPAQWWIPALALYTGARVQELAQFHTEDVEKVAGIWGLHIAARFPGQRIKNRQSKRFIPIHPALLEAGFLNYVAQVRNELGSGPLFPGLGAKPGDAISDWFNRTYLRQRCHIQGEGQVFHCFRHTFSTAADRLNIPEGRLARITGHSQGTSVLRGHYIDVPTLPERAATVAQIAHSAVNLQRYDPDAFTDFFAQVKKKKRREKAVADRQARAASNQVRR